jgi:hypothetical protein
MDDPILPRNSRKDPQALGRRMERAAVSMHREESKVWATLSLAVALNMVSGCSPAPTPAYGTAAPLTQTASPGP